MGFWRRVQQQFLATYENVPDNLLVEKESTRQFTTPNRAHDSAGQKI